VGPAAGGLLVGLAPDVAYGTAFAFMALGALVVFIIPKPPKAPPKERPTLSNMLDGFRFIWKQKLILGAISLDLFAVLMGGVIALLPIYAEDSAEAGPGRVWAGCGRRRASARSPRSACCSPVFPIQRPRGARIMFMPAWRCSGAFTVVFGLSTVRRGCRSSALILPGRRRHGERGRARDAAAAVDAG
jgi:hypothetical protein